MLSRASAVYLDGYLRIKALWSQRPKQPDLEIEMNIFPDLLGVVFGLWISTQWVTQTSFSDRELMSRKQQELIKNTNQVATSRHRTVQQYGNTLLPLRDSKDLGETVWNIGGGSVWVDTFTAWKETVTSRKESVKPLDVNSRRILKRRAIVIQLTEDINKSVRNELLPCSQKSWNLDKSADPFNSHKKANEGHPKNQGTGRNIHV